MKAKQILVILSLSVLATGAGTIYEMETGRITAEFLPWFNLIAGALGMVASVVFWHQKGLRK